MSTKTVIHTIMERLSILCPEGYALGLNISLHSPRFLIQTYAKSWAEEYAREGLLVFDPTVIWAVSSTGWKRWSEFSEDHDSKNMLKRAASHGLHYGVVASVHGSDNHSLGGFARSDREFTNGECDELLELLSRIHKITDALEQMPDEMITSLRELSVRLSRSDQQLH